MNIKTTEAAYNYVTEQSIAEEEALKKGMKAQSREEVERTWRFTVLPEFGIS